MGRRHSTSGTVTAARVPAPRAHFQLAERPIRVPGHQVTGVINALGEGVGAPVSGKDQYRVVLRMLRAAALERGERLCARRDHFQRQQRIGPSTPESDRGDGDAARGRRLREAVTGVHHQ